MGLPAEQSGTIVYRNALTRVLNRAASFVLWPVERILTGRCAEKDAKVVFIVGPPRSGTTLCYELLVTRFHVAYFSNFTERLFRTPATATLLGRRMMQRRAASFDSDYGYLSGAAAPSESGRVWRNWMPDAAPFHLPQPGMDAATMRKTAAAINAIMGGPLVVKYLFFAAEIPRLAKVFPAAVFIHIERDWMANAKSLLQLRLRSGKPEAWPSTRPEGWKDYAGAAPPLQASAHVALANREIEAGLATIDPARHMHIDYADLCRDPRGVLASIRQFMERNGMALRIKAEVPQSFNRSAAKPADPEIEEQIRAHIATFR